MNRAPMPVRRPRPKREAGVVMIVTLMFLVLIAMVGLYAAQGAAVDERVSGNDRDRGIALQAAEAALRDAEASLAPLLAATPNCETLFVPTCVNGLCGAVAAAPAQPLHVTYVDRGIRYGTHTGRAAFAVDGRQPSRPPQFLVEFMLRDAEVGGIRVGGGETRRSLFRVWAWGWGNNPNTSVLLEGMFYPPENYCQPV